MTIDLNADIGEGFGRWELGDDRAMLGVITSANIACGFHAGDPRRLLQVCRWAAENGVAIGAQVSYRDLAGFGRRFIDVDPADLTAEVIYQIGALDALARVAGSRVSYVKPHGALYNAVFAHRGQAEAVVAAIAAVDGALPVLGQRNSALLEIATAAGLPPVTECFADRGYRADGSLVPREEEGALVTEREQVVQRAVELARTGRVTAVDGTVIETDAASICVHGDTPGAVDLVTAIRAELSAQGLGVAPFTGS